MNDELKTTNEEQFELIGKSLLVRAPAKINLSLLIAGKRPDGFHEIETIMTKITWYDKLLIETNTKAGIELVCKGPHWSPAGTENLVYRAAELLMKNCGRSFDIRLTLTKNIPAGTGLGSASSNAAATLIGLNKFLKLNLPKSQLRKLAGQLGSDVTFFLSGPLALCTGKGEKIRTLSKKFEFVALLILADVSVSTKAVYDNYQHNQALYDKLAEQVNELMKKNRIDLVSNICANMLEESCFNLTRNLIELKTKIESLGISPICLSGSGSTMFYLLPDGSVRKALIYKHKLEKNIGCKSIIVRNNRW